MNDGILRSALREPLLHFLAIGAMLFLFYGWFGDAPPPTRDRIVVDEAQLLRLAQQFERTWLRPPTRDELSGLADDFVNEEILYREALALGLDKDDLVIRRRMRQKMEFLNADLTAQQATDAELADYLRTHPERFLRPARYSFEQVYFDPRRTDGDLSQRVAEVLGRLQAGQPPADRQALGDPTLLPSILHTASAAEIANHFGTEFAAALEPLTEGTWSGPVRSAFGEHLVRVLARQAARLPPLDEARSEVEREWEGERRRQADALFYQQLRERYAVEIRLPPAASAGPAPAPESMPVAVRP